MRYDVILQNEKYTGERRRELLLIKEDLNDALEYAQKYFEKIIKPTNNKHLGIAVRIRGERWEQDVYFRRNV